MASHFAHQERFSKIREKVYEIVGICFLDDFNDNYIENSIMLFDQILEKNSLGGQLNLKNVMHDVLGLYQACYLSEIQTTLTKIVYPQVSQLLKTHGNQMQSDPQFLQVLLYFYEKLIGITQSKY